jgi:hypothetical protein
MVSCFIKILLRAERIKIFILGSRGISLLTVDVKPGGMFHSTPRVMGSACISTTVFRPDRRDVQVAHHISVGVHKLGHSSAKKLNYKITNSLFSDIVKFI